MKNLLPILLLLFSLGLVAQVPKTINFQGYLTDPSSTAIDGTRDMKFSLFDAVTGGNELWFEDKTGVIIAKGLYNVILGDTKPVDLPFDKIYFLQVKVGTEVLLPRITLTSNAYSISSINASNITSGTLNGALVGSGINATNITSGTLSGSLIGTGINASNVTSGSLSGSLVGTGINATNITSNSLALANGGTGASTTSAARTNLGLSIGSDIQAYNTNLDDLADGSLSGTKLGITAGSNIILTPVGSSLQISTGGSALSGSGANGQVTFWNGPGSFSADGNLVWDNTNKRLGLGVSSPTQKLDVNGTVNALAFAGSGSTITSLNASSISSGTLADARLESVVDLNALNVGNNAQFVVNNTGNLSKINDVSYTFPSVQGGTNSFLLNNGSGLLSWAPTLPNSSTTATNANTASAIVARDASGNFSAGTITAALNGNASTVTTNANLTGDVTSVGNTTSIASGVIINADINSSAAIADSKLATISTAGKVSNSATTATNANTASAIVARDASGNFSAGTITATLNGSASTVTTNANLTGDVTSVGNAATIAAGVIVNSNINGSAAIADSKLATISTAGKVSNSATTATGANTASAIVARDASGNFIAGTITANLAGNASTVTTNANLTGDVTSSGNTTSIASGVIVNADINGSAAIADSKLATISTAGKVAGDAIISGTIGGSTAISTSGTISTSSSYVGATGGVHVGNTTAPGTSGNLEVDGYTKLGGSGVSVSASSPVGAAVSFPIIRVLKITGTTAAADGTATVTLSGLTSSKILSIQVIVDYDNSSDYVPPGFTASTGLQFTFSYQGGVLFIRNTTGNSGTVGGGKPFKAVIIYEQ